MAAHASIVELASRHLPLVIELLERRMHCLGARGAVEHAEDIRLLIEVLNASHEGCRLGIEAGNLLIPIRDALAELAGDDGCAERGRALQELRDLVLRGVSVTTDAAPRNAL